MLKRLICGILLLIGSTAGIAADWQMPPTSIPFASALTENPQRLSEADNYGHVMLLTQTTANDLNAYYYTNGAWTLSTNLLTSPSIVDSYDVAMEPTGTALAIFVDENDLTVNTRYFNGTSWSTPTPNPLDSTLAGYENGVKVAMNGPGEGVAVWLNTTDMVTSFFSGGTWSSPQIIGPSNVILLEPLVYSANGTAAVVWFDPGTNSYYIANFNGTSWQPAQALGPSTENFRSLGIDANGNVYAIAIDGTDIIVVHFDANTSTIVSSQTINSTPAGDIPTIAVAPNGTAVAVWNGSSNQGYSNVFNGTSWGPDILFAFGADTPVIIEDVSVDTNGNALVVWNITDGSIVASRMALGSGVWSQPSELVAPTGPGVPLRILSALSANGIGFASWVSQIGEFESLTFANASINELLPPIISGTSCSNKFATQTDFVNIITFIPSPTAGVIAYNLRRNGVLIAIIPASGPYIYIDHNLSDDKTYVYSLTAVNAQLEESVPAILVLKG